MNPRFHLLLRLLSLALLCCAAPVLAIQSAQVTIPAGTQISVSSLPNNTCLPPHASPGDAPALYRGFSGPDDWTDQMGNPAAPADADIAAGPSHVVAVVNNLITIYTKDGTCLYQVTAPDWFGAGCTSCTPTDPKITYDPLEGHWILAMLNVPPPPNTTTSQIMFSVSQGTDPTGSWWNYIIDGTLNFNGLTYNDYTDVGFDAIPSTSTTSGAIYITTQQLFFSNQVPQTQLLYILPKAALYAGSGAIVWRAWDPINPDDNKKALRIRTAKTLDPTIQVEYLLNTRIDPSINRGDVVAWKVIPTYPGGAVVNWTLAVAAPPSIGTYSTPPAPVQAGTCGYAIANVDTWLYNVVLTAGKLYSALTYCSTSPCTGFAKIKYFSLTPPSLSVSVKAYSDPNAYLFYPAIAADSASNIYLVNARSSSSAYLSMWDTGQLSTEIQPEAAEQLRNGSLCVTGSAGGTRWGDYFGAAQDPVDTDKVWVIGEYAKELGYNAMSKDWGTWISELTFSPFFNIQCTPSHSEISIGSSGQSTCTIFSKNLFSANVNLSCAGLPAGVTCGYNPTPVAPPANGMIDSILTVAVGALASPGTYSFQAVGASGTLTRTTTFQLTIPPPSFRLSISPSVIAVKQGNMNTGTVTVTSVSNFSSSVSLSASQLPTGLTAVFSPTSVTPPPDSSASSTLTLTASASAPVGPALILVIGTSGSLSSPVSVPVNILTGSGLQSGVAAVDTHPSNPPTNLNGVFDPNETVVVAPTWTNLGTGSVTLSGTASSFMGPTGAGVSYAIVDTSASYGSLGINGSNDCFTATGNCYQFQVLQSGARPVPTHWDATYVETLSTGSTKTWTLHVGNSFADVLNTNPFYKFVETLLHVGVTAGCDPTHYCPSNSIQRNQMAIFVLRAVHGATYTPPPATGTVFTDVPANSFGAAFIEEAAHEGIMGVGEDTTCGPGMFCPTDLVTRQSMAYILLRGEHGGNYAPPSANCTTFPFFDVPCPSEDADFVAELLVEGITAGCDSTHFCPTNTVTRAQMAVFLTATFKLNLYQ